MKNLLLASILVSFTAIPLARGEDKTLGAGSPSETLPPPGSDPKEAPPPVPGPALPRGGLTEQAGIGSSQSYARAGVLELGGSAGFTHATGFTQVIISPSVGWFFMDNVEASAIINVNFLDAGGRSFTQFSFLLEPSFHLPFTEQIFGFVGVGLGAAYTDGPGAGFAVSPRIGGNFMIGRSGILTPAFFATYTTTSATSTPQGQLLAVSLTYGLQVGYTVMW